MKLGQLAAATDVSTASIKYYLREGLLQPGAKKNATTAVYDDAHVARLELIQALRRILGAPITRIAALTALIDDPATPTIDVLNEAQNIGTDGLFPPSAAPAGPSEKELVAELIAHCDWPDRPTRARATVERLLTEMAADGYLPSTDHLTRITSLVDSISRLDLTATTMPSDADETVPGGRDRLAMRVAVGTHRHSQLLVALLTLGHASHSIRRFGD
ncbi:MerR family transcriptional regulator [uncultured Corynebacterium sp.]|uniref:MerR family transcriptional regulator n=1 Tax=uncultured Corynebacterium sp. TaxID=159447 RepID=UPI0025EFD397|nr:MerR family transcriptional regulator [uncultured Corynebacterium sp.]